MPARPLGPPHYGWITSHDLVPLTTRYRKYADQSNGIPRGFATPTRKVDIYAQRLLDHGYPPLPEYVEPVVRPVAQPDLAAHYPLILTCAKLPQFCHSQHRALPRLRRLVPDPEVELHPTTAAERGIQAGDWVVIATPHGRIRARARLKPQLDPRVVYAQHGWWQGCTALGLPGYDPRQTDGANYNVLISHEAMDPVSGVALHRSYLCQISNPTTTSLKDGPMRHVPCRWDGYGILYGVLYQKWG